MLIVRLTTVSFVLTVVISKEVISSIPTDKTQSMNVGDEVIWCVVTQDVYKVECSISGDTLTMLLSLLIKMSLSRVEHLPVPVATYMAC